jgi:hypothetical protein
VVKDKHPVCLGDGGAWPPVLRIELRQQQPWIRAVRLKPRRFHQLGTPGAVVADVVVEVRELEQRPD